MPQKSKNDASHIAVATVNNCNAIVSWNFKHMVNLRAITAVDATNIKEGYWPLRILSPSMLLREEEENEGARINPNFTARDICNLRVYIVKIQFYVKG
ncbi:hypothetical protein AGMMS49936_11650 [Endomicrobiia bacterium]|nr:hypothetical protein AGMMS49936_11650 [Endomicrobiia bacterium]